MKAKSKGKSRTEVPLLCVVRPGLPEGRAGGGVQARRQAEASEEEQERNPARGSDLSCAG